MLLRRALDALASVLLPAPCRLCVRPLLTASWIPLCDDCLAALAPLAGPLCAQCGRPFSSPVLTHASLLLCHLCRRGVYAFDCARSFGSYNNAMHGAITLLKYERITCLGNWFAGKLAGLLEREAKDFSADMVIPVPLHPARQRERGYNQAQLIAGPLARRLGLPLATHVLVRVEPRPDKLLLSRRERWKAVRGAYATLPRKRIDKRRVLLVDDVFTTGATLDACARVLRKAGAAVVYGATVARVVPNFVPEVPKETRLGGPASA